MAMRFTDTRDVGLNGIASLDKDGFEPALFVTQPVDDEQGPQLVFAMALSRCISPI